MTRHLTRADVAATPALFLAPGSNGIATSNITARASGGQSHGFHVEISR